MSYKQYSLLLTFIAVFLNMHIANACSCAGTCTVLNAYEGASVVLIAKAISVEKAAPGEGWEGIKSTKMVIEKVFKGNLKIGDEMTFGQGHNMDCIWGFYKPVGQRFLLYLGGPEKHSGLWYVFSCSRSRGISEDDESIDDLLYLSKLWSVIGKTRISGAIEFGGGDDTSVEGIVVRIVGGDKSYEVKTNKEGVYEIYDLPAGEYLIEPQVPTGWELYVAALPFPLSIPRANSADHEEKPPKRVSIALEDKRHAILDMRFVMTRGQ
jgi:hypothetical protein